MREMKESVARRERMNRGHDKTRRPVYQMFRNVKPGDPTCPFMYTLYETLGGAYSVATINLKPV